MGTLVEAARSAEERLFVGRERELAFFREWLSSRAPQVLYVSGPGGVGKTALVRAFARCAASAGLEVISAPARAVVAARDDGERLNLDRLLKEIPKLNAGSAILLIDGLDEAPGLLPLLHDHVLPALDSQARVVLAGRQRLSRASIASPLGVMIRPIQLECLTPSESRLYLERRGIRDPAAIERVLGSSGRLPLALSLAADMVLELGFTDLTRAAEWRLAIRTLVERLLEEVSDAKLRSLLEVCGVVRHFDEDTLAAVSAHDDVHEAFEQLCRLSIVRAGERGLSVHDDVRRVLRQDLRWRNNERYRELRLRALDYYTTLTCRAGPEEREWLLAERLYLCEDGLLQSLLFAEEEPTLIWVSRGDPEDRQDARRMVKAGVRSVLHSGDRATSGAEANGGAYGGNDLEDILEYEGTRVAVAREADGLPLGFNLVVPVCRESMGLLPPSGRTLVEEYLQWGEEALPDTPANTNVHYLYQIALTEQLPGPTLAALLRDMIGLCARDGVYLASPGYPLYQAFLRALRFERVPLAGRRREPARAGYVLDLTLVGMEGWIHSLISGTPLPVRLRPAELARELQEALLHWRDDERLLRSPLLTWIGHNGERLGPDGLREAILRALELARSKNGSSHELACRAIELAYIERVACQERVAQRLAVSRATFYRLLKRGVADVADAFRQLSACSSGVAGG